MCIPHSFQYFYPLKKLKGQSYVTQVTENLKQAFLPYKLCLLQQIGLILLFRLTYLLPTLLVLPFSNVIVFQKHFFSVFPTSHCGKLMRNTCIFLVSCNSNTADKAVAVQLFLIKSLQILFFKLKELTIETVILSLFLRVMIRMCKQ